MTIVKQYRKKPVTIDAVEFVYSDVGIAALKDFCGDSFISVSKQRHPGAVGQCHIGTLEDGSTSDYPVEHIATEGDFIIKGVEGGFYPCKPDIFWKTYEEVPEKPLLKIKEPKSKLYKPA